MSSDGDTIRRPKRHKMISDSDSDDSVVQSHRRKKFHRLVSESDNSDDDSDLPKPVVRRKNYEIKSENESDSDSEESDDDDADYTIESDSSQWQSDWRSEDEIEPVESSMEVLDKEEVKTSDGYDSDKSDGTSEKCPICLLPFRRQDVASPSSCEHCFCLECIVEWSKNINTCPVDRTSFTVINVRNKFAGQIVRHIPIEVKPPVEETIVEDPTFCEICHQSDREDRMLLCDGCDSGYHLECLTPPLSQVPIEEWFCPDCSQNSQFDAEAVEIDMDEVPDLMEEARRLGLSYGRTRGTEMRHNQVASPRLIPRTRQTERVQANIRAHRITIHRRPSVPIFDPNQPSTSSGLESVSENSRSRSPVSMRSQASTSRGTTRGSTTTRRTKSTKTKRKKKKKRSGSSTTELRKVVITEINEDGEEQQTVSYVKVTSTSRKKSRKKSRKRRKLRRTYKVGPRALKKRLVKALGLGPKLAAIKSGTIGDITEVSSAKFRAGIPQLSLFGNNLGLDFSPPGSEDEADVIIGTGPCVQTRPRTAMNATRRRMALKGIIDPVPDPAPTETFDLLSSILENQKLWHSKKTNNVTVKADGTLLVESNKIEDKRNSINNNPNNSPVKKKEDDKTLDLSNVNPNSITQAPMYNSPRGGGGGNRGGHFRSNNYRDNNRHSYGGQNYNTHEGYAGNRHSYGGAGNNRDFNSPTNYNSNFDHRNQTPPFGGNQFRNRNPHFRNRFAFPENDRPPFPFPDQGMRFPRPRMPNTGLLPSPPVAIRLLNPPPLMSMDLSQSQPSQENLDVQDMAPEPVEAPAHEEEDCDLYSDIQAPTKVDADPQDNAEDVLLPPPEPPSGLLDFEENSKSEKDNDSDQELVIDDTPKEEASKEKEKGEKYDPFDDSESNDSKSDKKDKEPENSALAIPIPLEPPPAIPNFAGLDLDNEDEKEEVSKSQDQLPQSNSLMNLTTYDDDEDEESQSDCPNFSIYSSQTMDVARHSQEEMAQICPLEPPPLPPMIPDDNDVVEGDVQGCDFPEIPEPPADRVDPYVQALQKERQTLNKIPPKKILDDSRGKITFKLQSKMKLNNKLSNLYDELDENVEISIEQDKQKEKEKEKEKERDKEKDKEKEKEAEQSEDLELEKDDEVDVDKMLEEPIEVDKKEEAEMLTPTVEHQQEEDERDEEVVKESEQFVPILVPSMIPMPPSGDRTPTIDENQDDDHLQGDNDGSHTPVIDEPGSTPPPLKDPDYLKNIDDRESSNLTPPLISKNLSLLRPPSEKETYTPERPADNDDTPKPKESAMRIPDMRSLVHAEGEYSRGTSLCDDDDSVQFPLEKDVTMRNAGQVAASNWESDGAYTPCKDELPVKESSGIESGLEPISPSKDKSDDLSGVRTPAGYAGLGTEAISETDEAMNYEDEPSAAAKKTKEKDKEMEEGEIMDENKAARSRERMRSKEDDRNKKKKKDKKDKTTKETEKNKENISSENMVAWKKISKNTKERQYREKDKRSRSKERSRKKEREAPKKKEKRKELPRYDVRKLVAEKPRKDAYGRDLRNDSRSLSRSLSRLRRSRSYSRGRSRSRSRASWGRGCRSLSRKRSRSRSKRRDKRRSISRERDKSLSRKRSISRRKSRSPRRRSRRRSVSRKRRSRSRSRERRKDKVAKKHRSRSRSKNRKRSRTRSPKRISSRSRDKKHVKRKALSRSRSISRERNRNWEVIPEKPIERETHFARSNRDERESWSAQWTPSWSVERSTRSLSPRRQSASPPMLNDVPPKNLTVILTNKDAIKKKKKEKRKEVKKMKEIDKRRKLRKNRVAPPSKEVFASGDNILVSVCFNEENETNVSQIPELPETMPLLIPTKRRRREAVQIEPAAKKAKKDKVKDKRSKSPKAKKDKKKKSKAAEIAATKKPVAVIDLDQSPFREQTPSPRDVIVLSDDDDKVAPAIRQPEQVEASSQRTPQHEQFVQGPKTPPEPQVKFSITKQTNNLRPSMMNPLLEEDEEEEKEEGADEQRKDKDQEKALNSNKRIAYCDSRSRSVSIDRNTKWDMQELEMRQKIGPDTPPERPLSHSPPTSPDAYDPFDPTKSRSPSPVASQEATSTDDRNQRSSPRKHDVPATTATDAPKGAEEAAEKQDAQVMEKLPEKPKIISMVTIKRASPIRDVSPVADSQTEIVTVTSESPSKAQTNQQNQQPAANPFPTMNPVLATVAAAVQRSSLFNADTIAAQRNLLQTNRISPNTQTKQQRANDRPQLPNIFANSVKPMTAPRSGKSAQNKGAGQNGNDASADAPNDIVDMSSPYSPGSSLSDGIFDPPSPANYNNGSPAALVTSSKNNLPKNKDKKDLFDALFDAPLMKLNAMKPVKKKAVDKKKKSSYQTSSSATNAEIGVRMDENQLQILDDLPSSAVEMQVKDKFLKKLNRQERVVEEVKLVLKPHYTKKHVTKEEYKDIMRKAVPKICHNKSGEINPEKIAHLIEAYVKKCRNSKKKSFATNPTASTAAASTANATAKTVTSKTKNLWS